MICYIYSKKPGTYSWETVEDPGMVELMASAFIALATVIISYLAFYFCTGGKKRINTGRFLELGWLLEKTPAQASYLMFMVVQSFLVITAAAFASRVSNHVILTLDILYLINILLLIRYHNLKKASSTSIQEI